MYRAALVGFLIAAILPFWSITLPQSACERVERVALVWDWTKATGQAVVNFVSGSYRLLAGKSATDETINEPKDSGPEKGGAGLRDSLSRYFYDRETHEALCRTDPIYVLRYQGKLNEHDLFLLGDETAAKPETPPVYVLATSGSGSQAQAAPLQKEGDPDSGKQASKSPAIWSKMKVYAMWLFAAIALLVLLAIYSERAGRVLSYLFVIPLKSVYQWHKDVLINLLPKSITNPVPGKDRIDKTGGSG
jgi:hypothetical protein